MPRKLLVSLIALVALLALLAACAQQPSPSAMHEIAASPSTEAAIVATCDAAFTPIYAIQGSGMTTSLAGETVTTQGVVVGDYEGASGLRGFYLQDLVGDDDPETSDGIFVFNGNNDSVNLGDVARITGRVSEFQGQTQIAVADLTLCGNGAAVEPVDVSMPFVDAAYLERYEGMLVRFGQTLFVTEMFQLGRFGQVTLTSSGRLPQPTQIVAPGAEALVQSAANALDRIILDDARNNQNPDPIVFGRGGQPLSASNTLRGGDSVQGVVGVLTYTWGGAGASGNAYRLRPVNALGGGVPDFHPANPRPSTPPAVGGTLRVGALNVLNYFDTFSGCTYGVSGGPTNCRGADDASEFERQAAKIVATIVGMDVDVLGLIEIENDGYGRDSALADLVGRLNEATAPGTYAFIDADAGTGRLDALGNDAIKVAFVYRPAGVEPVGTTAALDSAAFVTGGDGAARNRPALAQAFAQAGTGAVFVASVNHLKSKGSACDAPDALDGQGNCNDVRAASAALLVDWLADDPTGMGDADVLILGDLNAYAKEDPVASIEAAGYLNLQAAYGGLEAYTYVFDGQWGSLDYALASTSLAAQVTGAAAWHTNADEPSVLDYNTNFKSAGQIATLFARDPFRASDHDPIIVGIDLLATPTCAAAAPSATTLWPPNQKLVPVTIDGVRTDDGRPAAIVITTVFQDEPVTAPNEPDGTNSPDATGIGDATVFLRAERLEGGNGRVYHVAFTASDGLGQSCVGSVQVTVPVHQGRNGAAVDDGPLYDSTLP